MRRITIFSLALAALAAPATAQDPEAGAQTYATLCAACHGEAARGDGPVAAGLPLEKVSLFDPGSKLIGLWQQRHSTVVPRSSSSRSMNFWQSWYGHFVMNVMATISHKKGAR